VETAAIVKGGEGWCKRAYTDNGFGLHPAKMNYSTLDDCGRADGRPCRGGTLKTPEAG